MPMYDLAGYQITNSFNRFAGSFRMRPKDDVLNERWKPLVVKRVD
ncbi:MAG: hypothetical protein WCP01_09115 [Methylococcaceae bacterium]|jgi:hypothetical protein